MQHMQQVFFPTWSRSRNFGPTRTALRSRTQPLGLTSLGALAQSRISEANSTLEVCTWLVQQALIANVPCVLMFLEDLGGHPYSGPSSPWALQDWVFQVLKVQRVFYVLDKRSDKIRADLCTDNPDQYWSRVTTIRRWWFRRAPGLTKYGKLYGEIIASALNPERTDTKLVLQRLYSVSVRTKGGNLAI